MLRNMIRLLLAFYISGLAYMAFKEQKINEKIKEAIQQETLEEKKEVE